MERYYLPPVTRTNAQTGALVTQEIGPFFVQIWGAEHKTPTDEEIIAYVEWMHGVKPFRIER